MISTEFTTPSIYLSSHIYSDKGYPIKTTSLNKNGGTEYEIEYTY